MKPKIYYKGFCWYCTDKVRLGWGVTPVKAYRNWIYSHMLPVITFRMP